MVKKLIEMTIIGIVTALIAGVISFILGILVHLLHDGFTMSHVIAATIGSAIGNFFVGFFN